MVVRFSMISRDTVKQKLASKFFLLLNVFLFYVLFSDSVVKSKVNLLEAEIKIQTDLIKQMKNSKTDIADIKKAADLLFSLKRDLALAEMKELLEVAGTDQKFDPAIPVIDWKSIPVVQDAQEIKLNKEIETLKLKLIISDQEKSRLKNQLKNKKLKALQEKGIKDKKAKEKEASDAKADQKLAGNLFLNFLNIQSGRSIMLFFHASCI